MSDFKPLKPRVGEPNKERDKVLPDALQSPPPKADDLVGTIHDLANEADANLGRLAAMIDALPQEGWGLPIPEELRLEIAAQWVAGPSDILEILGYARDEEAFVFGRRIMRVLQEDVPTFEHLNFELAASFSPYQQFKPQEHWAELIKNRTTWLSMLRDAPVLAEVRQGDLPAEEGGERVNLGDVVRSALRRDHTLSLLLPKIRHTLGC